MRFALLVLATTAAQRDASFASTRTRWYGAERRSSNYSAPFASGFVDDARIIGMGSKSAGRSEVDRYWGQPMGAGDWTLDVVDVGGRRNER